MKASLESYSANFDKSKKSMTKMVGFAKPALRTADSAIQNFATNKIECAAESTSAVF